MLENLHIWLCFALSSFFGAAGAWLFSIQVVAGRFMDTPNERSSHLVPTPKGGGMGILAAFLCVSLSLKINFFFFMPIVVVSLLGLVSDRLELGPVFRLCVQGCMSLVIVFAFWNNNVQVVFTEWSFSNGAIWSIKSVCLMAFWTVFITGSCNFYNFMDGINGIAGFTGIVAFLLVFLFRLEFASIDVFTLLAISMAMACLGFLPMNFPNARVFMGDVGSLLLGFFWGAFVFVHSFSLKDFMVYISFLFPFYSDELTTMVARLKAGESLLVPHRRHLYQILVNERANSHLIVTILYAIVQGVVGISMIIVYRSDSLILLVMVLMTFFICFSLFSWNVRQIKKTGINNA